MADAEKLSAGDLFVAALEIDTAERDRWLVEHCADKSLLADVYSLLAAHAAAGDFLASPAIDPSLNTPFDLEVEDLVATQIGVFTLERVLGRGGMSAVYLGRRTDGRVKQSVAIKVIRRGMDSSAILARFHTEGQALAALEHPNIARFIDAGATENGRPYLVMEYVDGLPIDKYCDNNKLTIDARVALFCRVCEAVQHAHNRLVVHRDLKPSNILVSQDGQVKLLDFGISKLLDTPLEPNAAGLTVTVQRMMTPRYASPEQICGEAISTGTDVYSLGVMLYELLTNQAPYVIATPSSREAERVICDTEPARPSEAVGTGSRRANKLAGDLDNIVLMAMRKEVDRRYRSVEHLADDLRRYQAGRPVQARPDTARYRATKFVRRNLVSVLMAGLVVAALVGATAVSTHLYLRSELAREEAEVQRLTASRVSDFLQTMMVAVDPVARQSDEPVTVTEILSEASTRLDTELAGEPRVAAALHGTMANTYLNLGELDDAQSHARSQHQLLVAVHGPGAAAAIDAQLLLARILQKNGKPEEARAQVDEALLLIENHAEELPRLSANAQRILGQCASQNGDYELAKRHFIATIEQRRLLGSEHQESLATDLNELGVVLVRSGEPDSAAVVLREALQIMGAVRSEDHTFVGQISNNLGWALGNSNRWQEAAVLFEQAVERYDGVFASDHPNMIAVRNNLARARQKSGDIEGAAAMYRDVIAASRARFGDDHENVGHSLNNFALMIEEENKDYATAANMYREALHIYEKQKGAEHPWSAIAGFNIARVLALSEEYAAAEPYSRQALLVRRKVLRENHPDIAKSEAQLGDILMQSGQPAAAMTHLQNATFIYQNTPLAQHNLIGTSQLQLGRCLQGLNRIAESRHLYRQALISFETADHPDSTQVRATKEALAGLD